MLPIQSGQPPIPPLVPVPKKKHTLLIIVIGCVLCLFVLGIIGNSQYNNIVTNATGVPQAANFSLSNLPQISLIQVQDQQTAGSEPITHSAVPHTISADGQTYNSLTFGGWNNDQLCFITGNGCVAVQGISPNLHEYALYTDGSNVYLNAYDPSYSATEHLISIIYLLKGTTAVALGGPNSFIKGQTPEIDTTSNGVYFVQRIGIRQGTSTSITSIDLKLVKIDGTNFTTILDILGDTGNIVFSSNTIGQAYILFGLNRAYQIDGSQANPVTGLDFISSSLSGFNYIGGKWYFVANKFDFNNNALVYEVNGTSSQLVAGLSGYDKFSLFSAGSSTYTIATKIVSGFCGDSPCYDSDLLYIPDNGVPVKMLGQVGTIVNDQGADGSDYVDKRGNAYVYANNSIYIFKNGQITGVIPNVANYSIMQSDDQNTYLITPQNGTPQTSFKVNI